MATTGYELVKESIFKEANEVSERLGKEPSNPKLLGAWEALTSVMKFSNGTVIGAYPEEIIPREMKENGCPLEGIE